MLGQAGDSSPEGGPGDGRACRNEHQDSGRACGVGGEDREQPGVAGDGLGLGDHGQEHPEGAAEGCCGVSDPEGHHAPGFVTCPCGFLCAGFRGPGRQMEPWCESGEHGQAQQEKDHPGGHSQPGRCADQGPGARADDQPEGCQGPGEAEAEREPGPEPVGQTQRERARPGVPDGLGYPGGQEGETAGIDRGNHSSGEGQGKQGCHWAPALVSSSWIFSADGSVARKVTSPFASTTTRVLMEVTLYRVVSVASVSMTAGSSGALM